MVLVALGGNDAESLLAALRPAFALGPRFHFLIKLHPRSGPSEAEAAEWLAEMALLDDAPASYSIESGDIYRLLPEADLVVVTYSSFALEAAALGYPLLCLALPDRISATPLRDLEVANVRFVATPAELVEELLERAESARTGGHTAAPDLGEYFFTRLDGESPRRWARAIETYLLDAHRSEEPRT